MKIRIKNSRRFRKGSMLGFILVIGICLAFLGFGMLQLGFGSRVNAAIATNSINARIAADAGLTDAIYKMNLNFKGLGPWPPSTSPITSLLNSNATYVFNVNNIGSGHFQIDSQGTSGGNTRTVHAITEYSSMFDYALFVTNDLFLHSTAKIDAYDSTKGPYGGTNAGLFVEIGSETELPSQGNPEEGITIGSNVPITGGIAVGTGLSPEEIWGTNNNGVLQTPDPELISGDVYSPEVSYIWGDIPMPAQPYQQILSSTIDLANSQTAIIGTGGMYGGAQTIQCEGLNLNQGSILEIAGNVILYLGKTSKQGTGCITMGQSSELRINPGSSLTLYVDDTFTSVESSIINNLTKYAGCLTIYGTYPKTGTKPPEWIVASMTDLYGVIYAPNVNIIIKNKGDFFGSVAARSCEAKNSGNIHYDLALANETKFFTGYIIHRWWEEGQ